MEYNNDTSTVFLDLAKAFNSISHEIFLEKAEKFNLSQSTTLLLKSVLANRTQCVKLGIDLSDIITINHGVSQGTVLGPLFFCYTSTIFLKNWNVKMMSFNLRMTRVLNANLKVMKKSTENWKYFSAQRQIRDIESAQLTLNADKTEMLFLTNHTNSVPEFTFKGEVFKPAHACRYQGVQIDSNLTFENQLNSVLCKMANAIRSLYLVKNQIPLKLIMFSSLLHSITFFFSGVFLQTLTAKNINRINKKINWGMKVRYSRQKFDHWIDRLIKDGILPAELFISKVILIKLQTDIRNWKTSKNFIMFTSCHNAKQNSRTNQVIIEKRTKTKWSKKSSILKSVQKWNKLPSSIRTFNSKTWFTKVLTDVLLYQNKNVTVNRQMGAFKSYFYLWDRTAIILRLLYL